MNQQPWLPRPQLNNPGALTAIDQLGGQGYDARALYDAAMLPSGLMMSSTSMSLNDPGLLVGQPNMLMHGVDPSLLYSQPQQHLQVCVVVLKIRHLLI